MRLLLLLVMAVLLLFGVAMALLWAPLPRRFPPPLSSARNLLAAVTVGVLGLGTLAGVAGIAVGQVSWAGRGLDKALAAIDLARSAVLPVGRTTSLFVPAQMGQP